MREGLDGPTNGWLTPPLGVTLGGDEVHVWRLALAQPADALARLDAVLADDERARAARFHFARDRAMYTVVRGALRTLAAGYLGCAARALVLGYQAKGKPYLVEPVADLRFNVSHSGDYALLAFARGCEVGVDIEQRRALPDLLALARISFSPQEYAVLCGLAAADQLGAFFACWSRKEAFIKVTGEGISQLAEFDVTLRPGEPARLLRFDRGPIARFAMHDLPSIERHAAALAVERPGSRIACWDWLTR